MKKTSTAGAIATLYYAYDPMCSWCWGFRPVWQKLLKKMPNNVHISYVLGGLAADSNDVMPKEMQHTIRRIWQQIQIAIPGTVFNSDFWEECDPRRSTYPACRAVIAAKKQNMEAEDAMILAIQQAYYLQARNPSDLPVLAGLAENIGLNRDCFETDIVSDEVNQKLLADIALSRQLGARGFPSLILDRDGERHLITIDYNNVDVMFEVIMDYLKN